MSFEKVIIGDCTIYTGDALAVLRELPAASVQCCVTSPPYWGLRDYGADGQIGLESTPEAYVAKMVEVFREVRRVLRDDGTLWLNLGDSYASGGEHGRGFDESRHQHTTNSPPPPQGRAPTPVGIMPKNLIGIPWRVAFALQADGWYLRSDIIWHKPNPMPESVTDRPTKAHEYIFLMSKSARYWYDAEAVAEGQVGKPGPRRDNGKTDGYVDFGMWSGRAGNCDDGTRNRRSVWTVTTQPYAEAHFATFPPKLIEPCIKAGCPAGGIVLDPFNGSGTTGEVCTKLGRKYIGIELNPKYVALAEKRIREAYDSIGLFVRVDD